jgi:hypothetical protein
MGEAVKAALHWLADDAARQAAVQATRTFAQSKQGATDLTVQGIVSLLPAALQPQQH